MEPVHNCFYGQNHAIFKKKIVFLFQQGNCMVFWHQPSTALFIVYLYSFFNDLESLDHQKFLSVTHTLLILYSFHVFFFQSFTIMCSQGCFSSSRLSTFSTKKLKG